MDKTFESFQEFTSTLPQPLVDQMQTFEDTSIESPRPSSSPVPLDAPKNVKPTKTASYYAFLTLGILAVSFLIYIWSFQKKYEESVIPSILLPPLDTENDVLLKRPGFKGVPTSEITPSAPEMPEVKDILSKPENHSLEMYSSDMPGATQVPEARMQARPHFSSFVQHPVAKEDSESEDELSYDKPVSEASIQQFMREREDFTKRLETDLKQSLEKYT